MATYKLVAERWLRQYEGTETPTYAAEVDVARISARIPELPWAYARPKDARMTWHTNNVVHVEGEEPNQKTWTGLDWNTHIRDEFDAALFCSDHQGSGHRAHANAACYRYVLPDSAVGKTLERLDVVVTSDPYNSAGVRLAVATGPSGEVPTEGIVSREGGMSVGGTYVSDPSFHTPDGGVVKREPRVATDGSVSWYPKTGTVTLSPEGFVLQKYLYVFVSLEKYDFCRGNWIEGSAYIENAVSVVLNGIVDGWTEDDGVSGVANDCRSASDGSDSVKLTADRSVPDVSGTGCCVTTAHALVSGTVPAVEDGVLVKPEQLGDEPVSNAHAGVRTVRGLCLTGSVTKVPSAESSPARQNWGVGANLRITDRISFVDVGGLSYRPLSVAYASSVLVVPVGLPAGFTGSSFSASWSSWLVWNHPSPGSRFNFWIKNGTFLRGLSDDEISNHALYDATQESVKGWTLIASVPVSNGRCSVRLPSSASGAVTVLVTAYVPDTSVGVSGVTSAGTSEFTYDSVSPASALAPDPDVYPPFSSAVAYGTGDVASRVFPDAARPESWIGAVGGPSSATAPVRFGFSASERTAVVASPGGLYESKDGLSWSEVSGTSGAGLVDTAFFDSSFAAVAGRGGSYGRMAGSGHSWLSFGAAEGVTCVAGDEGIGGTVVAGTDGNGLLELDVGSDPSDPSGWTWEQTDVADGSFGSVISVGNGKFLAAGDSGLFRRESSVAGWTDVSESVPHVAGVPEFTGVCKASSVTAYAVSDRGVWVTGDRGDTWTRTSLPEGRYRSAFCFGGRIAVAGESGVWMSDGGDRWACVCPDATGAVQVLYAGSRWVAVATAGIFVSVDGTEWRRSAVSGSFTGVAYGDGRWVAVGPESGSCVSYDAVIWEKVTVTIHPSAGGADPVDAGDLSGIRFLGDRWVVFGPFGMAYSVADTTVGSGTFWIGMRWADPTMSVQSAEFGPIRDVVAGSGCFVAVGDNGVFYKPLSDDYFGWYLWFHALDSSRENPFGPLRCAAVSEARYVVGGTSGAWTFSGPQTWQDPLQWSDIGTTSGSPSTSHIPGVVSAVLPFTRLPADPDETDGKISVLTLAGTAYSFYGGLQLATACSVVSGLSFRKLLSDPDTGDILVSCGSGIYLSTTEGVSWVRTGIGADHPPVDPLVRAYGVWIVGSADNGVGSGLLRSVNGVDWEPTSVTSGTYSCACSDGRGCLYAGGPSGLVVSVDAGRTWTAAGNDPVDALSAEGGTVFAVVRGEVRVLSHDLMSGVVAASTVPAGLPGGDWVVTASGSVVVAVRKGAETSVLWRSSDGGRTFRPVHVGVHPVGNVTGLSASGNTWVLVSQSVAYRATAYGAHVSSDGGVTWRRTHDEECYAAGCSGSDVVIADQFGFLYSHDGGGTWGRAVQSSGSSLVGGSLVLSIEWYNGVWYMTCGSPAALWTSTDGAEWSRETVPFVPGRLYLSNSGEGSVVSVNRNMVAVMMASSPGEWGVSSLPVSASAVVTAVPRGQNWCFFAGGSVVYHAAALLLVRGGATFDESTVGSSALTSLSFAGDNRLVAGTADGGILYTGKTGSSEWAWTSSDDVPGPVRALVESTDGIVVSAGDGIRYSSDVTTGTVLAKTGSGEVVSVSRGDSFVALVDGARALLVSDAGVGPWRVSEIPSPAGAVVFSGGAWVVSLAGAGLVSSADGGATWSTVSTTLPGFSGMACGPDGTIVAASSSGVYRHESGSPLGTWTAVADQPSGAVVYDGESWIVTLSDGGLMRSSDGVAWSGPFLPDADCGLPVKAYGSWCVIGSGALYVSSDGGSAWNRVVFPESVGGGTVYSASCSDGVLVVAKSTGARIVYTDDAGRTWKPAAVPSGFSGRFEVQAVRGRWILVTAGIVFASADLMEWSRVPSGELDFGLSYRSGIRVGNDLFAPVYRSSGLSSSGHHLAVSTLPWSGVRAVALSRRTPDKTSGEFDPAEWERVSDPVVRRFSGVSTLCIPDMEVAGGYV